MLASWPIAELWGRIAALPRRKLTLADLRRPEFLMYQDQRLATYYAPFDFVNRSARLALVGVTPGPTQMLESFESARDDLNAGRSQSEALERVKLRASFKGMRLDLGRWLDELGLAATLGLPSCSAVFEPENLQLLHTTSAIRYPTFRRNREGDWVNYSGFGPAPADHPFLASVVREILLPELQGLSTAIIVPLGKAANAIVEALCDESVLPRGRCIVGMPHPSPASPHRERYFQQARSRLRSQAARVGQPGHGARRVSMKPQRDRHGVDRPRERSTSQRTGLTSDSIVVDKSIHIQLTQGNINNNHVYLREHLGFFPPDAIGGPARSDGEGTLLTVHFDGLDGPVETDIAGGNKLFFRARTPWGRFFDLHGLGAGDFVTIERLDKHVYRVRPGSEAARA